MGSFQYYYLNFLDDSYYQCTDWLLYHKRKE